MCMNPEEVKELSNLVASQIKICQTSEELPATKDAPYVPPEHQKNLTTLACIIETLGRRIDGVLLENNNFDIDALNHSFGNKAVVD